MADRRAVRKNCMSADDDGVDFLSGDADLDTPMSALFADPIPDEPYHGRVA